MSATVSASVASPASAPPPVAALKALLEASAATPEFKSACMDLEIGRSHPAISVGRGLPAVKALRATMKLLEEEPTLALERIEVTGQSGCSDFEGSIFAQPGDVHINFRWDCAWRANQMGYKDAFGYPDQIRAARQFGYQCFETWSRR